MNDIVTTLVNLGITALGLIGFAWIAYSLSPESRGLFCDGSQNSRRWEDPRDEFMRKYFFIC